LRGGLTTIEKVLDAFRGQPAGSRTKGRKAAFARDGGLSALPSSALIDLDRPHAFFTYYSFTSLFCLYSLTLELYSRTASALHRFADGLMTANTKRPKSTEWRGHLHGRLRRNDPSLPKSCLKSEKGYVKGVKG
jgi:hypothetical protein